VPASLLAGARPLDLLEQERLLNTTTPGDEPAFRPMSTS
jgi:hypothetical protein